MERPGTVAILQGLFVASMVPGIARVASSSGPIDGHRLTAQTVEVMAGMLLVVVVLVLLERVCATQCALRLLAPAVSHIAYGREWLQAGW